MSNVIQDGTFLQPIQIGTQNIQQWTDWTGAGITTQNPAPTGIPGDYASIPVGGDLFQDFSALAPGNYTLTFYVENQSAWNAKLVLAVQQYLGTPISELFAAGTAEELSLPASMTSFVKETLNFTITPSETFTPQELYFSNSYDAPIPPITNSINPAGAIIDIADVSLSPTPFSWARGVSGDFANASNWTPTGIPGPANDVTISAKGTYTVTSSADEIVDSLNILDKRATLFVTGPSTFTMTWGGVSDGTITIDSGSTLTVGGSHGATTLLTNNSSIDLNAAALVLDEIVSLEGNGKVILSDNPSNSISGSLFESSNTISGAGTITFDRMINDVGGIIDATGFNPLYVSNVEAADGWIRNLGTLESTNPNQFSAVGGLEIDFATIYNYGIIEANGPNTHVELFHCDIVGGTLETRGANAVIYITSDGSVWDGSQSGNPVNIIGHVQFRGQTSLGLLGTINNEGSISLENSSGVGDWINVNGDVTLKGGGHITLTNSTLPVGNQNAIFGSGVLTNVDNTISGTGVIGNYFVSDSGTFLINEAAGIIDANQSTPLILEGRSFTNAGLMEATHNGTLVIDNAAIENLLAYTNGTIDAAKGSTISLESATIAGGFVTTMNGGTIEAENGSNTISGSAVTNAGTIGVDGGNLAIVGDVANSKGVLDASNGSLVIDGVVAGGKATLEGTGEMEFGGASSANVTFGASTDAILKLDKPSTFTGTVSGLTTGDYIDFANINFADNPTVSYSSKTHVLTVTDSVSHVTDSIKLAGTVGSFSAQSDGNGGTSITDPPPSTNMVAVTHDSFVFAPNIGENAGNATHHVQNNEPIDFSHHGGELADLAALMVQAHAEGAHLLATPDAVDGHHAAVLTGHHSLV